MIYLLGYKIHLKITTKSQTCVKFRYCCVNWSMLSDIFLATFISEVLKYCSLREAIHIQVCYIETYWKLKIIHNKSG